MRGKHPLGCKRIWVVMQGKHQLGCKRIWVGHVIQSKVLLSWLDLHLSSGRFIDDQSGVRNGKSSWPSCSRMTLASPTEQRRANCLGSFWSAENNMPHRMPLSIQLYKEWWWSPNSEDSAILTTSQAIKTIFPATQHKTIQSTVSTCISAPSHHQVSLTRIQNRPPAQPTHREQTQQQS